MFLLHVLRLDGSETAELKHSEAHVIERLGYRDCSGEEIKVYDVSEFGQVIPLEEVAGYAPNYHRLIDPQTGRVVIEGYSSIH